MKPLPKILLSISRPRFWLYLAGPYAVGYIAGTRSIYDLWSLFFGIHLIYFLLPANLLLYGINDLFDTETDRLNPKKEQREHRLGRPERKIVWYIVTSILTISLIFILLAPTWLEKSTWILFLFLSIFYSAKPLRFKSIPFLDFLSNILYGIPAFLAYLQTSGSLPYPEVIFAVICWTGAMHLYSAIPDIGSDRNAGIRTTATLLGHKMSLLLCAILWAVCSGIVILKQIPGLWENISLIYPIIPLVLLFKDRQAVRSFYWYFPLINAVVGFSLFWYIVFSSGKILTLPV